MAVKSIDLIWIVVKDLKKAIQFYTETMGLKLLEMHEEYGWAELQGYGEEGAMLGIAQTRNEVEMKSGQNAFITFTVENIEQAKKDLEKKGAKFIGNIETVPGHVMLQMGSDHDGNHFQLVQKLYA